MQLFKHFFNSPLKYQYKLYLWSSGTHCGKKYARTYCGYLWSTWHHIPEGCWRKYQVHIVHPERNFVKQVQGCAAILQGFYGFQYWKQMDLWCRLRICANEVVLKFYNSYDQDDDVDLLTGEACYKYFESGLWFEIGKSIYKKYHIVFKDHFRYVLNNIYKPCKVIILCDD